MFMLSPENGVVTKEQRPSIEFYAGRFSTMMESDKIPDNPVTSFELQVMQFHAGRFSTMMESDSPR
jgi:hypothetical protein